MSAARPQGTVRLVLHAGGGSFGTPTLRTAELPRLLDDCVRRLGFVCVQQVTGVLALLRHGPLTLQLWACGAPPGRWEQPQARERAPAAQLVTAQVAGIKGLHASLRAAQLASGDALPMADRWPCSLQLAPWGGLMFAMRLRGGHVLRCEEWALLRAQTAAAPCKRPDALGPAA
jgi:hypothetical protein